jgi:hypothetical protein
MTKKVRETESPTSLQEEKQPKRTHKRLTYPENFSISNSEKVGKKFGQDFLFGLGRGAQKNVNRLHYRSFAYQTWFKGGSQFQPAAFSNIPLPKHGLQVFDFYGHGIGRRMMELANDGGGRYKS